MRNKKQNDYFEMFHAQSEYALRAAKFLKSFMDNYDTIELPLAVEQLHTIENDADNQKRLILELLAKEFLPPIELEDIMSIACCLDDVTDSVEDILRQFFMCNVTKVDSMISDMISTVYDICETLTDSVAEFRDYKKSDKLPALLKKINELEERGDQLYIKAMRALYVNTVDAKELLVFTGIYNVIENCCDTCEHAADAMELTVLKNS